MIIVATASGFVEVFCNQEDLELHIQSLNELLDSVKSSENKPPHLLLNCDNDIPDETAEGILDVIKKFEDTCEL